MRPPTLLRGFQSMFGLCSPHADESIYPTKFFCSWPPGSLNVRCVSAHQHLLFRPNLPNRSCAVNPPCGGWKEGAPHACPRGGGVGLVSSVPTFLGRRLFLFCQSPWRGRPPLPPPRCAGMKFDALGINLKEHPKYDPKVQKKAGRVNS